MLKVLHSDKAKAAVRAVPGNQEPVSETAQIAEEFSSLLDSARGKVDSNATRASVEALAVAAAAAGLTPLAQPKVIPQQAKAPEASSGEEATSEVDEIPRQESVCEKPMVIAQAGAPSMSERGPKALIKAEEGEDQTAYAGTSGDETSLPTEQKPIALEDVPSEQPKGEEQIQLEEWSQAVVGEAQVVEGEESVSHEDASIEIPSDLPAQVSMKPERVEKELPPQAVHKGLDREIPPGHEVAAQTPAGEMAAEQSAIAASIGRETEGTSSPAGEGSSGNAASSANPAAPVARSQSPIIRDIEIAHLIVDSASSILKRSTEASTQMMLLRQSFEQSRGQGREGASAISGAANTAGPSPFSAGAFGGAPKGSAGESGLVREAPQPPLNRSATLKLLERVQASLKEAARARDGKTISLHLDPVDLGRIKVDVSLRDGALHARLTPENPQVMNALREHAHELQAALRRLGLDVEKVTVRVSAEHKHEDASPEWQAPSDGKGFQGQRHNMPADRGQVAENTFGNELAQGMEGFKSAPEEAKSAQAGWRDNWVA